MLPGQRVLLVEDLATDGRSKINFVKAIRDAGGSCDHCTVLFFYDIYPEGRKILADIGVTLNYLTTWWDVLAVAKASGKYDPKMLAEVETFMAQLLEAPSQIMPATSPIMLQIAMLAAP